LAVLYWGKGRGKIAAAEFLVGGCVDAEDDSQHDDEGREPRRAPCVSAKDALEESVVVEESDAARTTVRAVF